MVIVIQGKLDQVGTVFSNHKALLFIVFSGIAGAMSWLFYFLAIKSGKVSQVVPIDRMSVIFALVLAFLFLGEKVSRELLTPKYDFGISFLLLRQKMPSLVLLPSP
jgi:transporter family protein